MTEASPATREIDLSIWPDWQLVSVTRRFVEEALERSMADFDIAGRVALAAHELLENAMKYGRGTPPRLSLKLTDAGDVGVVTVCVTNQSDAHHVDAVRKALDDMGSAATPFVHYLTLMRSKAKEDGSGLGLARICAEADMTLDLECVGDELHVTARGEFERRAA